MENMDDFHNEYEANLSSDTRNALSLHDRVINHISKTDNIPASEVNLEYIIKKRQTLLYKSIRYDIDSPHGGYSTSGLKVYTHDEFDLINHRADLILDKLSKDHRN